MSHQVTISDEAYQTIAQLASKRGQTPEELLESWAGVVSRSDMQSESRYQTFEEFFTDLGMTPVEIQAAKDDANL